jgi:hypothetical protein
MIDQNKAIVTFARAVLSTFGSSEWTEIGYLTGTDEWIDKHPRLLRSLSWGDEDYKGHVFEALKHIIKKDPANLEILLQYEPIARWIDQNEPAIGAELREELSGEGVEHVEPLTSTDSGLAALADAQALLRTRGPSSAVDRVHTGLHAFLKAACKSAQIGYPNDASANQLLRLLLEQHPRLTDLGPRSDDIRRMIRASGAIVDALGTLRNQASLAHPNEEVLGPDEALFVINLARSLLRFLDAKVSSKAKE